MMNVLLKWGKDSSGFWKIWKLVIDTQNEKSISNIQKTIFNSILDTVSNKLGNMKILKYFTKKSMEYHLGKDLDYSRINIDIIDNKVFAEPDFDIRNRKIEYSVYK